MPRDPNDVPQSDYAFLEGRVLRLESEQKAIRRVHDHLAEQVEGLTLELRRFREDRDPWRETTDIRNQRGLELQSLRARAREADEVSLELQREKASAVRRLALLAPSLGALLYGLAELVRSFIHH